MCEVVFKNELVSVVWDNTRLDLLDSDGNFIDYFFDSCFLEEKEQEEMIQSIINELTTMGTDENKICFWAKSVFDSIFKIEPYCGDKDTIKELREQWGDEYVCRIGNTALIISE